MLHLVRIESIGEVRTFTNAKGEQGTAVEIELSQADDTFVCTAFDKIAEMIKEKGIAKGVLAWADLRFYVSGIDRKFQNVRLNSLNVF